MSLKYVHILFITLSTILAWLFSAWCFVGNHREANAGLVVGGIVAALLGFAMVLYGIWFLKKAKRLIL